MNALLSAAYFPCIQYISKFLIYDKILIEVCDSYSKQTYRNRCTILGANGTQTLSIPVKKNKYTHTKDVIIDYSEDWQRVHARTILSAYKNSPFYDYFETDINNIIFSDKKFLIDLNILSLEFILKIIKSETEYSLTQKYEKSVEFADYRDIIHPKKSKQKKDKLFKPAPYLQVFSDRFDFCENLSTIDLIFNEGSNCINVLKKSISM